MMDGVSCNDAMVGYSSSEPLAKPRRGLASLLRTDATALSFTAHSHASSSLSEWTHTRSGSGSLPTTPLHHHVRRGTVRSFALVDLTINNEVVPLNLTSATLPCAFEVEIPLHNGDSAAARRYNGLVEMRFVMHVRHCSVRARNLFLALRLPWNTTHYLGPLAQQTAVTSARLVDALPPYVTLIIDVDRCLPAELTSPLPCEMLLKEHVKTILDNDEFCGSIAAAHVQNLVRDLPFYDGAMRRFRTWSEYVTLFAHSYRCWELVVYADDEHAALALSSLTPPGELRLVANHFADRYTAADVHRDKIKWRALCDFRDQVLARCSGFTKALKASRKGEPTMRLPHNLLRRLGSESSFRTLNSVNYLHVLEALVASRLVLFSSLHPIQVDNGLIPDTSADLLLAVSSR